MGQVILKATVMAVIAAASSVALAHPVSPHKKGVVKAAAIRHMPVRRPLLAAKPTTPQAYLGPSFEPSLSYPWLDAMNPSASAGARLPGEPAQAHFELTRSYQFAADGDAAAKAGDWTIAKSDYQQALDIVSHNQTALRGLARCAEQSGDMAQALSYFRAALYTTDPNAGALVPGDGFNDNDPAHLMEFVIALSQAGQEAEALHVYQRAAMLFNADSSNPAKLPDFGHGDPTTGYTPARIQAVAHAAIGKEEEGFGNEDAPTQYQKAVALAPDCAVAHYYRGSYMFVHNQAGAKAEYQKAIDFGDDRTIAAAKMWIQNAH